MMGKSIHPHRESSKLKELGKEMGGRHDQLSEEYKKG